MHQLEYLPGQKRHPYGLTPKSQTLILEWCQQHGLLGVLLSRWEAISLAPQHYEKGDRWVQRKYDRGFGQVIQFQETTGDVKDGTATVLIHGLNDLKLKEEPPGETWSRFLPHIEHSKRDTFSYPQPYTLEFCQRYGEPLFDFCKAAKLLFEGNRQGNQGGHPRQRLLSGCQARLANLLQPLLGVSQRCASSALNARRRASQCHERDLCLVSGQTTCKSVTDDQTSWSFLCEFFESSAASW